MIEQPSNKDSNLSNKNIHIPISKNYAIILNLEQIPDDYPELLIKKLKGRILDCIKCNDSGDGVKLDFILNHVGADESPQLINKSLKS